MAALYSQIFSFNPENLAQTIEQESDFSRIGCWHHRLQEYGGTATHQSWYLGIVRGKVVFSGMSPLSMDMLLTILSRYRARLRSPQAKQLTQAIEQNLSTGTSENPLELVPILLQNLYDCALLTPQDVRQALRLKILSDFDEILFNYSGQVEFLPDDEIETHAPMPGFPLTELLDQARRRQVIWDQIKLLIPSLDSPLRINEAAVQQAHLSTDHEKHLRMLVAQGDSISGIATALAQDTLEIAKGLAKLVDKGLLQVPSDDLFSEPEILVIDDSPLMLKQFQMLVSSWGYRVRSHADPTTALSVMLAHRPAAIFLDINMPELSGFDLLKQIRRQPKLSAVPLIMLTAERTLSNNWRAQWSGCKFLSKPLTPAELPRFREELFALLEAVTTQKTH